MLLSPGWGRDRIGGWEALEHVSKWSTGADVIVHTGFLENGFFMRGPSLPSYTLENCG